ncbi:uncharacterized protein CLUP02_17922 [Colletotrichum lupini]|uniref:MAPEG family protein n=1 Tax=Colletotrichum lupini TaxID=145971 RepID=A0A9Q8SFM3_9PEZI|nr:uncharacterized protein CLUP02_17922 [Colletotrichum lupini]UQC76409.1 hypothetical protein CLUP02_17922 [Colletotrichum lupini]
MSHSFRALDEPFLLAKILIHVLIGSENCDQEPRDKILQFVEQRRYMSCFIYQSEVFGEIVLPNSLIRPKSGPNLGSGHSDEVRLHLTWWTVGFVDLTRRLTRTQSPNDESLSIHFRIHVVNMTSLVGLAESNLSYYSVPLAYMLAFIPHVYANTITGDNYDVAEPRRLLDAVSGDESLDKRIRQRIQRAKAAHDNATETLGLYAAGVVAANSAGFGKPTLDVLSLTYLFSRAAYTLIYVKLQDNRKWAPLRSLVWIVGMCIISSLWIKAGNAMNFRLQGSKCQTPPGHLWSKIDYSSMPRIKPLQAAARIIGQRAHAASKLASRADPMGSCTIQR